MIERFRNNNFYSFTGSPFNWLLLVLLLASCAQQVAPGGGPKDTTPPEIVKSTPENFSTSFNASTITLVFDEYVQLKDINNQLIISPPLEKNPKMRIKGKSLVMDFESKFKENTTYTFNFGNSIADITENNILDSNLFIFSTGSFIDSLTLSGKVETAFNIKAEKEIYVMLYQNTEDSVPYKEKPAYLSKTKENGTFQITNIKNGNYKAFALKDLNNNFIFDQPAELIAFSDSLIIMDTSKVLNFLLFEEAQNKQYLKKSFAEQYGKLTFIFNLPTEKVEITPLHHTFKKAWFIEEASLKRDTVSYWLTDIEGLDTLSVFINDNKTIADTAVIAIGKKESKTEGPKGRKKAEPLHLSISNNAGKSTAFDLNKSLLLQLSHPIIDYDLSKIVLTKGADTLKFESRFEDEALRRFEIKYTWQEDTTYQLFIPPGTFHDIFGLSNDTLIIPLKTQQLKHYGNLKLKYDVPDKGHNYIVQLMDEKEGIVMQSIIKGAETINYGYLDPKPYKLKIIYDLNNNGKWDTGNYLKKLHPEKVIYYQDAITVRSNWDMELEWKVEQNSFEKGDKLKAR